MADENQAEGATVIDIVDAHRLKEIDLDKKAFMAYIKGYLKKIKEKLTEAGKADRVPEFQKGATELVKMLVGKFDEVQIFCGENYDMEAGMAFAFQDD